MYPPHSTRSSSGHRHARVTAAATAARDSEPMRLGLPASISSTGSILAVIRDLRDPPIAMLNWFPYRRAASRAMRS